MNFNEVVQEKVDSFLSKIETKDLDPLDPEICGMSVELEFFAVSSIGGTIIIPIGTREAPKGLAASDKKLVLILNEDTRETILSTKTQVRDYMRLHGDSIQNKIGVNNNWETMCMITPYDDFKSYVNSEEGAPF